MTLETANCEALELPDAGSKAASAPSIIHLMPLGAIRARDGREWFLDRPERLIASFRAGKIDLPIDYEHQTSAKEQEKRTGPIPAAGWITALEKRPDGIWGHVKWTETAAQLIRDRAYRFISPEFQYDTRTREIERLVGAGLVHTPALHLTALAREEPNMSDAPDTALCTIAGELGLPETATAAQIIDAIHSLTTADPDPAKYVPIEAVRDLMADRQTKIAAAREGDVERAVDQAIEGGYITPGMREWATALCRRDPQSFTEFMQATPPAYAYLKTSPFDGKGSFKERSRAFDETELAICTQLGIEPGTLVKD